MAPEMVQLNGWRCERCGHTWLPRKESGTPKVCPKCKSPYWDRPRRKDVEADAKKEAKKGKGPRR